MPISSSFFHGLRRAKVRKNSKGNAIIFNQLLLYYTQ